MTNQIKGQIGAVAPTQVQLPVKVKYCLYARKSTESEEQQILSIDSQIKEMLAMAERDHLEVVEIKKESHSAKEAGHRAPIVKKMFEKIAYENMSGRRLHAWLKDEMKFKTRNGKVFSISNIYITLRNHFYYGTFEYPKGSGHWYNGKHTPIITKELFDTVQEKMVNYSLSPEIKEFAFTKLMTCGLCGSGITASEKFKKQQNGNVHHYVYYGCCRFHDKDCTSGYMREEDLIEQLAKLMDKIDLDEIGIKERIKVEIERHKKFQSGLLGIKERSVKVGDVDMRNYAKYVLRDGTLVEKRELLTCLRSKITMAKKEVKIA